MTPLLSIYHDTRRPNKDGRYPVRIRLTFRINQGRRSKFITRYYGPKVYASPKEFGTYTNGRSEELRRLKATIDAEMTKIRAILKRSVDTPDDFEAEYYGIARDTVNALMERKQEELTANNQLGSAVSYQSALSSFVSFCNHLKGTEDEPYTVRFPDITPEWLRAYESWMLKSKSVNTIGIYLRNLRHIFNLARGTAKGYSQKKLIPLDMYPFNEFQIKTEEKYKIPLSDSDLVLMKAATGPARDYFLFSYYCNGMNMADVIKLRHSDIQDEFLIYDRKKTRRTKKKFRAINIPLDHEILEIIKRIGAKTLNPKGYVFPVLEEDLTEVQIRKRCKEFTKKLNEDLKSLGESLGIKKKITTVIARHTYANRILNATDGDTRMIQEGLGHSSAATSEHYKGTIYLEKVKKARGAL